ncbi:MAG: hypothetical protein WD066_09155 [Planctomycetaceae bacterium]
MFRIASRFVAAFTVLIPIWSGGAAFAADEPADLARTAEALSGLEPNLLGENERDMVRQDLRARIRAANDRGTKAWNAVQSPADWEKYRDARLAVFKKSLGEFPEPPKDLRARVTGRVEGDGYVIENTVFECRPGFWVTANVYVPKKAGASRPGIVINGAHHTAKEHGEMQDMGMTWARNGCVVIVPDHLGYGERREHPFVSQDDYAGNFQLGRQNYYFRYDTGVHLHLVGDSLLGWMAYDLGRCVDYLTGRPDVDKSRIIVLGGVAGGGEPAAALAAIDQRIAGAVIFNFGGPQPETRYPLPDDAETSFNYAGGGGWESTRNQRFTAAGEGCLPWVTVAIAPRKLGYAHEFSWDTERDPVWRRYEKLYDLYGKRENLAGVHGRGLLSGRPPEASHCTHIGKIHREMIHPPFRTWFAIDVLPEEEYSSRVDSSQLKAMTPEAEKELKPQRLTQLLPALADERLARARAKYENASGKEYRQALSVLWDRVLEPAHEMYLDDVFAGRVDKPDPPLLRDQPLQMEALSLFGKTDLLVINKEAIVKGRDEGMFSPFATFHLKGQWPKVAETQPSTEIPGAEVERVVLQVEREVRVPLLLVKPAGVEGKLPVVVAVASTGKAGFLKERNAEIAKLLAQGIAVCLPDLRATGETRSGRDAGPNTGRTSESSTELMLGGTQIGRQLHDLLAVLSWMRTRDDLDLSRRALWGDSFAPVNPPETNFKVPRRVSSNVVSPEPTGALLVLLAGMYAHEKDLDAIYAAGGLGEFRSVLTNQIIFIPHDVLVPGMFDAGDLCDLAAASAPRPLRLAGIVDHLNQPLSQDAATKCYDRTATAYQQANAADAFSIAEEAVSPADWLAERLKAAE